jgi:hypothetical protein
MFRAEFVNVQGDLSLHLLTYREPKNSTNDANNSRDVMISRDASNSRWDFQSENIRDRMDAHNTATGAASNLKGTPATALISRNTNNKRDASKRRGANHSLSTRNSREASQQML